IAGDASVDPSQTTMTSVIAPVWFSAECTARSSVPSLLKQGIITETAGAGGEQTAVSRSSPIAGLPAGLPGDKVESLLLCRSLRRSAWGQTGVAWETPGVRHRHQVAIGGGGEAGIENIAALYFECGGERLVVKPFDIRHEQSRPDDERPGREHQLGDVAVDV